MQFFDNGILHLIQIGKQLKWMAGLVMLMLAARGMRDRELPELAARMQPVGMPLVWLRRAASVALGLGAAALLALAYQNMAAQILQFMSEFSRQGYAGR